MAIEKKSLTGKKATSTKSRAKATAAASKVQRLQTATHFVAPKGAPLKAGKFQF